MVVNDSSQHEPSNIITINNTQKHAPDEQKPLETMV